MHRLQEEIDQSRAVESRVSVAVCGVARRERDR